MNLTPLFWTLILLAMIVSVLLSLAKAAQARLKKRNPPIGQMIDIGGYRLHVQVEGNGNPTVVFDSGAGGIGLGWELVRPAIAKVTRVVVYDRAGLGWSESGPRPRTASRMAEELHILLQNGNIPGPYVLVGHSLGGPVARQFAARYPEEVAGLVMVDSAHEQQMKHFPEAMLKMADSMKGMLAVMRFLSVTGIFALNPKMVPFDTKGKLPAQTVEKIRTVIASSGSHLETMIAESEGVYAAETSPVKTLGDLPLTVISHGRLDADAVPPSLGQQVRDEYERAWQKLQVEITSLSTRGRRIVAERSGHDILLEQPEIVIESILQMIDSVNSKVEHSRKEVALSG